MNQTVDTVGTDFLAVVLGEFRKYKKMAEKVFDQLEDQDFYYVPDEESNSIAVIIKHMAGNMRSRWTDFLTADGEKPDRHRDTEFVEDDMTLEQLLEVWNAGWQCVFDAVEPLDETQLLQAVYIKKGHPSAARPLRASRGPDRLYRQASQGRPVGFLVDPEREIGGVPTWQPLAAPL